MLVFSFHEYFVLSNLPPNVSGHTMQSWLYEVAGSYEAVLNIV